MMRAIGAREASLVLHVVFLVKGVMRNDTQPISEERLIAILTTLPTPIHSAKGEDGLDQWDVAPRGKGTAQGSEDAFEQSLSYALTTRSEQILKPSPVIFFADEPFSLSKSV